MVDTSWAERRRRMVKCKVHGLHFDPQMSTGCVRCLREAARTQPKRPPQLVVILLCMLGMAFILFYIFRPGQGAGTGVADLGLASQSQPGSQKLDPEPYRAQIEDLERALFRTQIDETGDLLVASANIAAATQDLSSTILDTDPARGLNAADLIARLGQAVPTDQVAQSDIETAQSQWLRIRKQQLLPADWFLSPPAAGKASMSAADYSDLAASLRSMIEEARAEAQAQTLADSAPGIAGTEAWRTFAGDWRQQLDRLENRLPARPAAKADGKLLVAVQDLEQALGQARALAATAEPPSASDDRFDDAVTAALRAQQGFDELR